MIGAWLLLACGSGADSLWWQDSWEVLAVGRDRAVVDARFFRTNTGLIRGQGHVRFDRIAHREVPVFYGRDALPRDTVIPESTEALGALRVGPDQLLEKDGTWDLRVLSGELDARLTLQPDDTPAPPTLQRDGWQVDAVVPSASVEGILRAGQRNSMLQGRAVILHRWGHRPPARKGTTRVAAFVMDAEFSLGIDQTGADALAWAWVDGRSWSTESALVRRVGDGVVEMDFRPEAPIVARLVPVPPHHRRLLWDHLSVLEQWVLARVTGRAERRIRGANAEVRVGEKTLEAPALILVEDYR
jgi:hypothetical protein